MHRLLRRQLRKVGIDPEVESSVDAEAVRVLLKSVDASYTQADEYRYLHDHALTVSSREMAALTSRVESARLEQEALREVATAVAEGRSSDDIHEMVASRAGRLFGACAARVFRLEGEPLVLARPVGAWGENESGAALIPDGFVPLARSRAARELFLANHTVRGALHAGGGDSCADHLVTHGVRSVVSAPIVVNGALWGALAVMFDIDDESLEAAVASLDRFASLASVAISNAEARQRLEELASKDHLTGLGSRRIFQESLTVEAGRALDGAGHLALVLIDFDDFKLVNDQLGHQAGDHVLRVVAGELQERSPADAVLARLGGDEFAWLLPGFSASRAAELMDSVQQGLPHLDLGAVDVQTLSAGVCDLDRAGGEPAELYRMADGALYAAKRSQPGTCVIHRPGTELPGSVEERGRQLERTRGLQAVRSLARAVDARDPLTHSHSERVADLAVALAERVGWDSARRDELYEAALVHDVGKIGVPDALLRFSGPLSDEEMEQIRAHAAMGAEILAGLLSEEQVSWVRHHHERWDGAGYPDGLHGVYIPVGARVMAVSDAFDAMVSDRPYRAGRSVAEAVREIEAEAGRQFDPELARAFAGMWADVHPLFELRQQRQESASPGAGISVA